ncbi:MULTISPECIES: hypothetical protein [Glycomyces]|uniref:Uncharacterized protein n=1 Tax=Glycomyces lechevalierae TaxID=256034 RepID=A0A9X3PQT6_9ACTN|nr:hypothetical protein [Glycomyces lechevalierae]MDA1387547.1 hypothetical protein [Glycomyces lechevalierae]MDR7336687.1 hypothetical protein [Glycomyces lechevalierae]
MSRVDSDEAYVLDLCDEVLGSAGLRQHRFDWLVGDPDGQGRRVQLPVDGYWPEHRLVIEYQERRHEEPVAHFDKPDRPTVSGVHRGVQRARYDARRRTEIPAHGLRLVEIRHTDLAAGPRGLHRERVADLKVVGSLLLPEPVASEVAGAADRVLEAFQRWLIAEGWEPTVPESGRHLIEAVRGEERLIGQVKGHTASVGTDVDTGYGQLLRRMADAPGIRYALIVPTSVLPHAERVPDHVRRRLGIDLYEVTDAGAVTHRANWRL